MIEANHESTCLVGGDHHAHSQFAWNPFKKDDRFTVEKFAQCIGKQLNQEHIKKYCMNRRITNCESILGGQIKDQKSRWVGQAFTTCKAKFNVDDGIITGSQQGNAESDQPVTSSSQTGAAVKGALSGGGTSQSKKSFSASSLTSLVVINKRYTRYQLMSFI